MVVGLSLLAFTCGSDKLSTIRCRRKFAGGNSAGATPPVPRGGDPRHLQLGRR